MAEEDAEFILRRCVPFCFTWYCLVVCRCSPFSCLIILSTASLSMSLYVRYAKYPDLYVDFMMNFELEMQVPGPDDLGWGPWKDGAITFSSFVFFGLFPLLAYAAFSNTFDTDTLFTISCVLSAIMFFILGTLKTKFTKQHWFRGGMEILAMGSSTAAVSYLVGWLVESALLARGGGVGGMH